MADSRLVAVTPLAGVDFKYAFLTRLDADDSAALGHVDVTANTAGCVYGCNAPKPARMFKIKADGHSVSSFVATASRQTARAAGWKQSKKAKFRAGGGGRFSKAVYIKLDAGGVRVDYAWNMKLETYNAIGNARGTLGILDVAGSTREMVWGCTSPKPSRVFNRTLGVSTLADPDIELPAGWSGAGEE